MPGGGSGRVREPLAPGPPRLSEGVVPHSGHQRAPGHQPRRCGKIASLTEIDRDGDPDDLVDAAGAARILRYASRDVIHASRHLGYFPEPDAYGTARNGRPAPLGVEHQPADRRAHHPRGKGWRILLQA
jgi:hypothetical protein